MGQEPDTLQARVDPNSPYRDIIRDSGVIVQWLPGDGTIPNNPHLATLVYKGAIPPSSGDAAANAEIVFHGHGWDRSWRNGIYPFHHYHSTAHEALCLCRGHARIMLGGSRGITVEVNPGDTIVLPAGFGHKALRASDDLLVVGAYPPGPDWDLQREAGDAYQESLQRISGVPLPPADPVYGLTGPLMTYWAASA